MPTSLAIVTLVVRDYDEAIAFFRDALGFELAEDRAEPGKRWVRMRPSGTGAKRGSGGASLLLARASTPEQTAAIGKQTGGRVGFFLHTDDFAREHRRMVEHEVRFEGEPREESYGKVAVFLDLYGNRWDLIQPSA